MAAWPVAGLDDATAEKVRTLLQERLVALIDLQLTLKHVHWNVVGPNFIGVHEMLDPHVETVRGFTDTVAERIATLGGQPIGTPGHVASTRSWDEYDVRRANVETHLKALDAVYCGLISDHRKVMEELEELDLVSHDMFVEQTEALELQQWFVRAHLANADGELPG
ncbi:DNA starvation/stationary phase protection protein Dps [Euzebya rosea]|uniref:DNA starvation/stationary phase protection protein Dps n=1 Tax=Euzebya rosea TaxID=2052804 RepID=UPI000D3E927B|nr:DNA starvation/stationary phase protection protein Dps [Euzebya rosea]